MTEEKTTTRKTAAKVEEPSLNIYERIAAISKEAGALAPESKGGVPFAFRGIDGTVAHLTPFLEKYGVFLAPTILDKTVSEREVGNRVVKTTDLTVEWAVYGPEGLGFTFSTAGLADDFADRSTAQASSVAYRIALLQLFHLPTHSREPEETGEDVAKGRTEAGPPQSKAVTAAKAASAPAAGTGITRLQQEAKALGRKLNLEPSDLNAMGAKLSGGKEVDVWFNDVLIMEQIRDDLKARVEAADAK